MFSAKLVASTKPTPEFMEKFNVDDIKDLIAFCARVSNPGNQSNAETNDRLINYLIKHKHWSPFEMANAVLEIETTRDIARQLLRHRSFTFQEFSQRYADPTKDLSFVIREPRYQDKKNRQNSISLNPDDRHDQELAKAWFGIQEDLIKRVKEAYSWAIANGIAKEQARAVLPEGLMASRLYVNGTIRSWIHYIDLRSQEGTQLEHRALAAACATAIAKEFGQIQDYNHYKQEQ